MTLPVETMEKMKSYEQIVVCEVGPKRPIRRIGLISPYSGGNLGDAAIIWAMIANLRKRIPGVEILGLTLNPDDTRRRHGIGAFPLAGVSRPYYTLVRSDSFRGHDRQSVKSRQIKQWLKQIPLLRNCLRAIRVCRDELAHIVAAAGVVRKLDRLIIAGGGALDESWGGPWGHPWTLFKWGVLSRVSGVPFLFVSVGKSSLKSPLSRFFVRIALGLAEYRSYRDEESKIEVQTLIDARKDPVFPDLAFSYPSRDLQPARSDHSADGRLVVGVSPIAYRDPRVWPIKDEGYYASYIRKIAEMVKWLGKEGHRVLFFTTDSPDLATVNDIQALLSSNSNDATPILNLPCSAEQTTDSFLNAISHADLTIASRLHGVILSHLNTTPVLAVSFDPKVDAQMNAIGQKDYCLAIDHFTLDRLIERFTALKVARQREQAHLHSAGLRFRELLDQQYDRILGTAHSGVMTCAVQAPVDAFLPSEAGELKIK
jgi:polysaccharide pyruvyl transferase WcaK-like protein